jgi:hypothetical protein
MVRWSRRDGGRMRRGRRVVAGAIGCSLLVGCTGAPSAAPPARSAAVTEAAPADDGEVAPPFDPTLLLAYGEVLAAAATTGGDALERTLAVTADDRDRFDAACAPRWAHDLLRRVERDGQVAVEADDGSLTVGTVVVPTVVHPTRVVHRTDAPCDGPLPHPERTTLAEALAALAAARTAAETAANASTATSTAAAAGPSPQAPAPAPAPVPAPPPSWDPELEPFVPPPGMFWPEEEWDVATFDAELADWAELLFELFDLVVDTQTTHGAFGGGAAVAEEYELLGDALGVAAEAWAVVLPPDERAPARDDLMVGLGLWRDELLVLATCVLDREHEDCPTAEPLRALWQESFAAVTAVTGIELPSGHLTLPASDVLEPTPWFGGGFNLGGIRLPSREEVRRSLDGDPIADQTPTGDG